jgi:hypothetical protein
MGAAGYRPSCLAIAATLARSSPVTRTSLSFAPASR